MKILVFVYGTLKRGYANQWVMAQANGRFIGNALVHGFACVNTPWYPYAIKKLNAKIKGEVFEIEEENLIKLDKLEGYPSHYNREITKTEFGDCWIYYSQDDMRYKISEYGLIEEWKKS